MVGGLAQMITNQQERIITGVNSAVQDMNKVIADTFLTNQGRVQQGETKLVGGNQQPNETTQTERGESSIAQDQREAKESRYRRASSSSLEESESESMLSSSEDNQSSTLQKARSSHSANWRGHKSIIAPFTGRETWKVWFTRFKDIARRQRWSDEDKLDILLPKLQGEAGSFVYDQLSSRVRNNYKLLKVELENRFRHVEHPKTYRAVFAAKRQKANESIEGFAAELKRIYDKAYARRDPRTRKEDLLTKFLDGLQDTKAAFHAEFVKDPKDIDTAVNEVINFQEVFRNQARAMRRVDIITESACYQSSDKEYDLMIGKPSEPPQKMPDTANKAKSTSNQEFEILIAEIMKQLNEIKGIISERCGINAPVPQQQCTFDQYNSNVRNQSFPVMWPEKPRLPY